MIVTYWKGVFVADSLDERGALKKAGFVEHQPNTCNLAGVVCKACRAQIGKRWWTDKVEAATRLKEFCNAKALGVMREHLARLEKSKAVDADIVIPAPAGLSYLGYQKAGIAYALQRKDTLIGDEMGLGKEHRIDTKILTPQGWTEIGKIKTGDFVIGSDGKRTKVTGVYPQGVKDSYRVKFSDYSSVEAGEQHLWAAEYRAGGRRWLRITLTTSQLFEKGLVKTSWPNGRTTNLDLRKTDLYLPMLSGPVIFEDQPEMELTPYLLGQLLSNGSCLGTTPVITCNSLDTKHIVKKLEAENVTVGSVKNKGGATTILIKNSMQPVRDLDMQVKSNIKKIPEKAFIATPEYRISLLHGLMDGDGSITKERCRVVYHSTSLQLSKDVVRLVQELGGIASIRTYDRTSENKPIEYQVRIRVPSWVTPFSSPRKASRYTPGSNALPVRTFSSVEKSGSFESVCISVDAPDRLYIVENCILTHNTVQALGFANHLKPANALVLCPASLVHNWKNEAMRWLTENYNVWPAKDKKERIPDGQVFAIVNYDKLGGKTPLAESLNRQWDLIVFDECQVLKNPDSARSKNCIGPNGLMSRAKRTLFLSGTPMENYPKEIWPIAASICPAKFGNWVDFAKRYCGFHYEQHGDRRVAVTTGGTNLAELQQRLRSTFMVRRLKKDVLPELPLKRRQMIFLKDDKNDWSNHPQFKRWRESYERDFDAALAKMETAKTEEEYQEAALAIEKFTGVAFTEMSEFRHATALAKLPLCIKYIDELLTSGVENLVVFAHHTDVIDKLKKHFGDKCVVVTGSTPDKGPNSREMAVKQFQEGKKQIFLGQIRAAGVGLTLTAANTVVFVEIDWVPGVLSQAEDRLCRIGQTKMVHVIHLVLEGTLDANMVKKIVTKQHVIDKALDKMNPISLKKQKRH